MAPGAGPENEPFLGGAGGAPDRRLSGTVLVGGGITPTFVASVSTLEESGGLAGAGGCFGATLGFGGCPPEVAFGGGGGGFGGAGPFFVGGAGFSTGFDGAFTVEESLDGTDCWFAFDGFVSAVC